MPTRSQSGEAKTLGGNKKTTCDVCNKVLPKGSTVYGCRDCDWDACQMCESGANITGINEGSVATPHHVIITPQPRPSPTWEEFPDLPKKNNKLAGNQDDALDREAPRGSPRGINVSNGGERRDSDIREPKTRRVKGKDGSRIEADTRGAPTTENRELAPIRKGPKVKHINLDSMTTSLPATSARNQLQQKPDASSSTSRDKRCAVCFDNPKKFCAFNPCGHHCCEACATKIMSVDELKAINDVGGLKEASDNRANVRFEGEEGIIIVETPSREGSPKPSPETRFCFKPKDPNRQSKPITSDNLDQGAVTSARCPMCRKPPTGIITLYI